MGFHAMPPEIGKKYGPYEIQSRLGGGGMGHVFLAWDARLHREVAIKLLHNEYAMPGMRERFLREARAASALNHPNICTIFDIGEQDGDPYLVMELLQGETLKDHIQHRTLHTDEIVCIAREVAEALGAAHAKGVIHRDIKPANIFLVDKPNGTQQAKVLDFGLAKIEGGVLGARSSRTLDITTPGATVGTLAYMSPEQARGEVLDSRSDLFSLGVVMYEMATRHVPFKGATSALIFVQLLNHAPEPVRSWNESISRDLEKIILKLMAKERTARFQTAAELEEALLKLGKTSTTSWLRRNSPAVPLVRPQEPVARDRRTLKRRSESDINALSEGSPAGVAEATPRPSDQVQFLRPVARVPRSDATPPPALDSEEAIAAETERAAEAVTAAALSAPPAQRPAVQDSGEFLPSLRRAVAEDVPPRRGLRLTGKRAAIAAAALAVAGVSAFALLHRGRFGPSLLTSDDALVLTEIENRTGDKSLDGTLAEGLQLELAQSRYLRMVDRTAYREVRRSVLTDAPFAPNPIAAHTLAEKLNAKAYLYGNISGNNPPYLIHVDMFDVASNEVLTSVEERVPSLQQLPGAIDRLADALRFNAGEERDSISKTSTGLVREATGNMDALHLLSAGDEAYLRGRSVDALLLYQQAATLEPKFVQAQLRIAVLCRKMRAEVEAGEAAKLALAAADGASERTRAMAEYQYEMNASGDYARAAGIVKQVIADYPHDTEAMEELARTLRLEGRFTESVQLAQEAYAEDPYNADAYLQAENSMIALDRYDAAAQAQAQAARLGIAHAGGALTSAYLEERQAPLNEAILELTNEHRGFQPNWNLGIYLDNVGRLAAGAAVWRDGAAAAAKVPGLASAAAFMLAQGALDRAMLGDCKGGVAMAAESEGYPQGLTATFNAGMAQALCGDAAKAREAAEKLQQNYPQSFAVRGFYVADLDAAVALDANDPQAALDTLKASRQYDLISLTPYLRGRADVALRQVQIGIVDFQTVLSHRGVPFTVGSVVYPVAEIGVARAFADTGDVNNSGGAYRRFLELWKNADPNQPLVNEAKAHAN
jgi:serine/threonine-protein kinase